MVKGCGTNLFSNKSQSSIIPSFIMVVISIPSLGQQMLLVPYKYLLFLDGVVSGFASVLVGDAVVVVDAGVASPFGSVVILASSVWRRVRNIPYSCILKHLDRRLCQLVINQSVNQSTSQSRRAFRYHRKIFFLHINAMQLVLRDGQTPIPFAIFSPPSSLPPRWLRS